MKETTTKRPRKKPQTNTKPRKSTSRRKRGRAKNSLFRWTLNGFKERISSLFCRNGELSSWVIWGGVSLIGIAYLAVVYFLFFRPYLIREEVQDIYFIRPYVHGVDISHHQGEIDWPRLSRATFRERPLNFAFMKATEGGDFVDDSFKYNFAAARECGIVRGAYHFFLPDVPADVQAQNFIRNVSLQSGDLPPVLDIEVMGEEGPEQLQQRAAQWLTIVERHYGVAPIIYASYKFRNKYLNQPPFTRYPYWIAHYYVEDLEYKGNWKFWQHTDSGRLDGIEGRVDLNIFNGNLEELMRMTIR